MRAICGFLTALAFVFTTEAADVGQLIEQLAATDREQRREAGYQLTQLGRAAKPALSALIRALDDADKQVWSYAVTAIGNLGPDGQDAIPRLIEGMNTQRTRGFRSYDKAQAMVRSADALARIGPAAKPALLDALQADDAGLRIGAAKALGAMGSAAADSIPTLVRNLGDEDSLVRFEASEALALMDAPAVPPLTEALNSSDSRVRAGSARSLGILGRKAEPAGPILLRKATDDPDLAARAAALIALPRLGLPPETVVPVLISAFKADQPEISRASVEALVFVRPATHTVVPALIPLLHEPPHAARAANLLARYGREARAAVPHLIELATKHAPGESPFAIALVSLGAPAVPELLEAASKLPVTAVAPDHWTLRTLAGIGLAGLPELLKALGSPNGSSRLAAVLTIEQLGADARESRKPLTNLIKDPEPIVRAATLKAVVAVGAPRAEVLNLIENALSDREAAVRLAAANVAGALAAQARPIAGKIAGLLSDSNPEVQAGVVHALGVIGGSGEWVEQLVKRLDDPHLQLAAIDALGKLQKAAIAPRLVELYPDASRPVKLAILGALAGAGDVAAPTLEAALQDGDTDVRTAALRANARNHPNLETFVPLLVASLEGADANVRRAAIDAASAVDDRASDRILPLVSPLMKVAENPDDRAAALEALRSLRLRDPNVLALALESPSPEVRIWGIERLGRASGDRNDIRAKIEPLTRDSDEYIRRAASRALRDLAR